MRFLVCQADAFECLLQRGLFDRIGWSIGVEKRKGKDFPQVTIWDSRRRMVMEYQPVTPDFLGQLVAWAYRSDIAELEGSRKLELMVMGLIAEQQGNGV